ncbi:hypothetical protein AAZX31_05G085900 [Glycine max]
MAHVPDKIKSIDGSRETLKLSVRITDLWFIGIPEKSEQAEMVIVDSDVLSCTLWKNCLQFLSYLNEVEDERLIVILLTHARIKEGLGSYPPSVNNSLKASKLMINELVLEIQEFKERLLDLGIEVRSILMPIGQGSSQVSRSFQLSSKDVFLSKAEAKNICQINAISESMSKKKKTDIETMPFTCPCGKDNDQPVLRYSVEVMVNHKGEYTKFLLWDRECVELIGQSADEVNRLKIVDGDVDLNVSSQALDRLLGCFLAFKVKVQPRFRNIVVLKYSDESDLINVVLDMLPDTEPCCKIESSILDSTDPTELEFQFVFVTMDDDRSMLDSTDPTELESQFVSVTADHDPLLRIPLTPTKRISSDELDDEPKKFEISPAQVSSNKLRKHCQAE